MHVSFFHVWRFGFLVFSGSHSFGRAVCRCCPLKSTEDSGTGISNTRRRCVFSDVLASQGQGLGTRVQAT